MSSGLTDPLLSLNDKLSTSLQLHETNKTLEPINMPQKAYFHMKMTTTIACFFLALSSCTVSSKTTGVNHDTVLKSEGAVTPPVIARQTVPKYTNEALSKGIEGIVKLLVTVNEEGRVIKVKIIKGLGYGLDQSAEASVFRWKFKPATQDGVPVISEKMINIRFQIT